MAYVTDTKLKILDLLRTHSTMCSAELAAAIGVTRSSINQHLAGLEESLMIHRSHLETPKTGGSGAVYWSIGYKKGKVLKKHYPKHDLPKIIKKKGTWAQVPKTDMSKGYGYVL